MAGGAEGVMLVLEESSYMRLAINSPAHEQRPVYYFQIEAFKRMAP